MNEQNNNAFAPAISASSDLNTGRARRLLLESEKESLTVRAKSAIESWMLQVVIGQQPR